MKKILVKLFPETAKKRWIRRRLNELERILSLERYQRFQTNLLTHPTTGLDGASFHFMFKEIFDSNVYNFVPDSESPLIIDGGANIGLSCFYFKEKFPKSKVLAFEADPSVFEVLEENLRSWKLKNVSVYNKALWSSDGELSFLSEGADGGRIEASQSNDNTVQTTCLSHFLNAPVDFLKLDIEGAEFEVLKECESKLNHVKNLFVEYHNFVGREQFLSEILDILKRNGFEYFISAPGVNCRKPLVRKVNYNGMNFQVNIHATKIKS